MIDTHYACNEILKRDGGKASCCYCTGHECKEDKPQQLETELRQLSGWRGDLTLGYLLRKLPPHLAPKDGNVYRLEVTPQGFVYRGDRVKWCAAYNSQQSLAGVLNLGIADTPEDALCKLAIELFKQGILTPELSSKEKENV